MRQRVTFKIATLDYKCLHGFASPCLARHCTKVATLEGRRGLRSAAGHKLFEPRTCTVRAGARLFAVCGPVVWNSLPLELRADGHSLASFRRGLKTFLYEQLQQSVRCATEVLISAISLIMFVNNDVISAHAQKPGWQ